MEPAGNLDDQLCFAMYAASRSITHEYRDGLGRLGLTYPQFATMLVLWEGDDLSVGQLGDRLRLDSGTLSPLLKRLETLGFVTRHRAGDDERRVHVRLTAEGRALERPAREVQRDVVAAVGLTKDEAILLRTLARRITRDRPPAP